MEGFPKSGHMLLWSAITNFMSTDFVTSSAWSTQNGKWYFLKWISIGHDQGLINGKERACTSQNKGRFLISDTATSVHTHPGRMHASLCVT